MHNSLCPIIVMASLLAASVVPPTADACTRAVYFRKQRQTVTGRTMDWLSDMQKNLWVFPRGLQRSSDTMVPFTWTSEHGSAIASAYGGATADGMNEKWLVTNMLHLAEMDFKERSGVRKLQLDR